MGIDTNGNVVVALKSWDDNNDEIVMANTFNAASGSWSGPVTVDSTISGTNDYRLDAAVAGATGNGIAIEVFLNHARRIIEEQVVVPSLLHFPAYEGMPLPEAHGFTAEMI